MRMFEYMNKNVIETLPPERRQFITKMIMRDVEKIAKEKGISEEKAYELYSKGLYGGDREVN